MEFLEIGRRPKSIALPSRKKLFLRDIADIGVAGLDGRNLSGIDIEADDLETRRCKLYCQGLTHVAKPDHTHPGGPVGNSLAQLIKRLTAHR